MVDKTIIKFPKDNVEDEDRERAGGKGYERKLK
jgi:hypothetical protein